MLRGPRQQEIVRQEITCKWAPLDGRPETAMHHCGGHSIPARYKLHVREQYTSMRVVSVGSIPAPVWWCVGSPGSEIGPQRSPKQEARKKKNPRMISSSKQSVRRGDHLI